MINTDLSLLLLGKAADSYSKIKGINCNLLGRGLSLWFVFVQGLDMEPGARIGLLGALNNANNNN